MFCMNRMWLAAYDATLVVALFVEGDFLHPDYTHRGTGNVLCDM